MVSSKEAKWKVGSSERTWRRNAYKGEKAVASDANQHLELDKEETTD